jgi:hypothetical protein
VEPTISQKRTVTVLRTSPASSATIAAPHVPQKRKPAGFSRPHDGQVAMAIEGNAAVAADRKRSR